MAASSVYSSQANASQIPRILVFALILFYFCKCLGSGPDEGDEILLCRHCGHEIAKAQHLMKVPSEIAVHQRNDTIMGVNGVLIQLFKNPQGIQFEVITSKKADVFKHEQAVSDFSWFPGFLWRIAVCPRCGFHLGWSFEPHDHTHGKDDSEMTFIGLILENLLHQSYADSLLITPKSYYS